MPKSTDRPAAPSARDRILHTAHDLFYREGIRATGIDRIIREAGVTKVTFYRHFPSKNDLVAAYLGYRHEQWMSWFGKALRNSPGAPDFPLAPVLAALHEWFSDDAYRGCAFINGAVEFAGTSPAVARTSLAHKQDMVAAIAALLPATPQGTAVAQAAAMAVDGAIVRAQMAAAPEAALATLETILRALCRFPFDVTAGT